jgi:hypothetical protein
MLNEILYSKLTAFFKDRGGVDIVDEDSRIQVVERRTERGTRMEKISNGEQYRMNCPFCGDKKKRLYISYAWGMPKSWFGNMPIDTFVICHNERCDTTDNPNVEHRGNPGILLKNLFSRNFLSQISGSFSKFTTVEVISSGKLKESTGAKLPFPSEHECIPVEKLIAEHPARRYLEGRNFDAAEIGGRFKAVYCTEYNHMLGEKSYAWLAGRLFFPTPQGWQARSIEDCKHMKYFSCPGWSKSKVLYGFEEAKKMPFVLITEGVTDVWRTGAPAVGLFGKSISGQQLELLLGNWQTIGVMLDPDTETDKTRSMETALTKLRGAGRKVFKVSLPDGRDPGECSRELVWKCVKESAAKYAVKLGGL